MCESGLDGVGVGYKGDRDVYEEVSIGSGWSDREDLGRMKCGRSREGSL